MHADIIDYMKVEVGKSYYFEPQKINAKVTGISNNRISLDCDQSIDTNEITRAIEIYPIDYENIRYSLEMELTFENVSKLAHEKGLNIDSISNIETNKVFYYEVYERSDQTLLTCKTLKEIINYLEL
jgi:hypothetical protein